MNLGWRYHFLVIVIRVELLVTTGRHKPHPPSLDMTDLLILLFAHLSKGDNTIGKLYSFQVTMNATVVLYFPIFTTNLITNGV